MAVEARDVVLEQLGLTIGDKTGRELYDVWKQGKVIEGILKGFFDDCRKRMFSEADKFGTEDEKGSKSVNYDDGKGFQKQARVSVKLNQDKAISYLKSAGLLELVSHKQTLPKEDTDAYDTVVGIVAKTNPELLTDVEFVEESDLETAILDGKIADSDLDSLVDRKVTYALVDLDKTRK